MSEGIAILICIFIVLIFVAIMWLVKIGFDNVDKRAKELRILTGEDASSFEKQFKDGENRAVREEKINRIKEAGRQFKLVTDDDNDPTNFIKLKDEFALEGYLRLFAYRSSFIKITICEKDECGGQSQSVEITYEQIEELMKFLKKELYHYNNTCFCSAYNEDECGCGNYGK